MGSRIDYRRPDGGNVNGYLSEGTHGAAAPGIVVIQEWWGLNDQIRGVADRLVAAGYRALVPDLYRGKVALEANEAEHLMKGLDFAMAAGQDVRGALQYLKASGSTKVRVTGFHMGGAVAWNGYPPLECVDTSRIRAPIIGQWATEDTAFPIAKVDQPEPKLRDANFIFEFHRYRAKQSKARLRERDCGFEESPLLRA